MAQGKKSFIAYADWKAVFDELPDADAGLLIKHIFSYVNDENPQTDSVLIRAVFANIKTTLKRDLEKWDAQVEQRRDAGKKSAESRKNHKIEFNDRSTTVNEEKRNSTDSVNGIGTVTVTEKENREALETRALAFRETLKPFKEKYGVDMLKAFYEHWKEPNKSLRKMRFEGEKFWDLGKRLGTWASRENNFKTNGKQEQGIVLPGRRTANFNTDGTN